MQKHTIAIIDDSPMMTQFLKLFFESKYNVVTYHSSVEAITDIRSGFSPDVIITDFDMPDMNGLDIINNTREQNANTPIIVVSGARESKHRLSCLEAGAEDFVMKPFHPAELDLRIQKQLRHKNIIALETKPSFFQQMARAAAIL